MRVAIASALAAALASAGAAAAEAPPTLAPPGAASCSGCHVPAARATAIPPIVGRPAADTVETMEAFRTGGRESTVMGRIAKGFTREETAAIAAWLATQR
ncbi:MAG: cytochrome c [Alphaproteobacteria bacterium]